VPVRRMRTLAVALAGAVVAAGLSVVALAPSAQAAPPTLIFPAPGDTVQEVPVFRWQRLPDATRYDIQVSTTSAFTSTLVSASNLANTNYAPQVALPQGTLWWRVRVNGSGEPGWSAPWSFTRAQLPRPTILGPTGDLIQPTDPPIVRWTAVDGAEKYRLQISSDPGFADDSRTVKFTATSTTSGAIPTLSAPGQYWSRVRADFGNNIVGDWSDTGTYTIKGLKLPEPVSPEMDAQVTDVVLDWKPVEGAATYDLQVDDDPSFESPVVDETNVTGTRFSPPKTIGNDDYWWRVRPVDYRDHARPWSDMPVWTFTRVWRGQPALQYPADGQTVTGDLYYQWSPSKLPAGSDDLSLSSSYTLEVSTDPAFNAQDIVDRCDTVETTFVPGHNTPGQEVYDCFPPAAGLYYWRVIAHDDYSSARPANEPVSRVIRSFVYLPTNVTLVSPDQGDVVTVPTVSWAPQSGAARYKVTMDNLDTGDHDSVTTASTSYTPHGALEPGTWQWQVQTVSVDNRLGAPFITGGATFELVADIAPTATVPVPVQSPYPHGKRFPTIRWTPVVGALHYEVWAKASGSPGYLLVDDDFQYAAAEDVGSRFLDPGIYDYFVLAVDTNGAVLNSSNHPVGHFTIDSLDTVPSDHQWASLTGTLLPDDPADPASDPTRDTCLTQRQGAGIQSDCDNLRNTPVISWPSSPDAGYYQIYVSRDKELANPVYDRDNDGVFEPITVAQPMWTPPDALPDSTAGIAYHYLVVPCSYQTCAPMRTAENSFDKLSRGVVLKAPTMGKQEAPSAYAQVACPDSEDPDFIGWVECQDDITLQWEDFRLSQERPGPTDATHPFDTETPLQTAGRTEARSYRVQTATDVNFTDIIETKEVDQTTFTSFDTTYPEGPVYWRVQAVDGSGNVLAWSAAGRFLKRSPAPIPTAPITTGDDTVSGDIYLSWQPRRFAARYRFELYAGGNPAPLVTAATVDQRVVSFTGVMPASPDPYQWRVRKIDVEGRTGAWSDWVYFTVGKPTPVLGQPNQGAQEVPPSDAVFTWNSVPGAASYRFQRLNPGTTTPVETVVTSSLAWAPKEPIPGGQWDWQVTALDGEGADLGTSPPRRFTVVDAIAATTPVTTSGSGRVGTTITATPPNWNFGSDVTTTYEWLRNGSTTGATGLTYVVTAADVNKAITVRATGKRSGYVQGTSVSTPAITGMSGDAPIVVTHVAIQGTGKTGTTLTGTAPAWDSDQVTTAYQWQRDGANVGSSSTTLPPYTLTSADVGHQVTLKATGTRTGYDPAYSTSNAITGVLGDAAAATTPVSITAPNNKVGTTLTANAPTWDVSSTTLYQWFRDSTAITVLSSSSSAKSYKLVDADIGHSITVQAVGRRTGYLDGVSTSSAVVGAALDPVVNTGAPTITGVAAARETLRATPGTWQVTSGVSYAYQWFVDGVAVAKETKSSYVVRTIDAGKAVSVRVTATATGWAAGTATTSPMPVAKLASTTTATLAEKKITQRQRGVLTVKVAMAGYDVPLGQIQVKDGRKVLTVTALSSGKNGTVTIRLKKLKLGKHKLTVTYLGSVATNGSAAKPVTLKVVRAQ
jgi:hypothetical protein